MRPWAAAKRTGYENVDWAVSLAIAMTASVCHADMVMMGIGTFTCGQFGNQYAQDPDATENAYFAWAQGFMSSMNMTMVTGPAKSYHDLETPVTSQKSQLRAYCNAHPLAGYAEAVLDLFGSLPIGPRAPN